MTHLEIIYQDEHYIFIDKPSGYHVHQPENPEWAEDPAKVCLQILRNQVGKYLYPLHRLDAATSGILGFGLSKEATKLFQKLQEDKLLEKRYFALVRGYLPTEGIINSPLKSDSSELLLEAETLFTKCSQFEIPEPVGKRFQTSRYSTAWIQITTGRYHQIRRHMKHIGHPLVGDTKHGDGRHNLYFREKLKLNGMFLRATHLNFTHPLTGNSVTLSLPWTNTWTELFNRFNLEVPDV